MCPGPQKYSCLPSQLRQCQISIIKPCVLVCAHMNSWMALLQKKSEQEKRELNITKSYYLCFQRVQFQTNPDDDEAEGDIGEHLPTPLALSAYTNHFAFIKFPGADVRLCPECTESHMCRLCPQPQLCVRVLSGLVKSALMRRHTIQHKSQYRDRNAMCI